MNFLAHLSLAERNRDSIIGNLMGDFRKYLSVEEIPDTVRQGIRNHQRVDKFTDSHEVVYALKETFSPRRRRYAGIILDVAFDHFLSVNWDRYNTEPREAFIKYSYSCLNSGLEYMPEKMQKTVCLMIREDWLGSYRQLSGIEIAINRLSRRIRFRNDLYGAVEEIQLNYKTLEQGFYDFFPALQRHVAYVNE